MATKIKPGKKVVREANFTMDGGRKVMAALTADDCVEVWHKGCRKRWQLPLKNVLHQAMRAEVEATKRAKKLAKKNKSS